MKSRLAPAAVAALFLTLACAREETQFPRHSPDTGNPDLLTQEDAAVYEVVLSDAQRIFEINPPPPPPPGARGLSPEEQAKLRAERALALRPYTLPESGAQPRGDGWRDLAGGAIPAPDLPASVLSDFHERGRRKASLKAFRSDRFRIAWTQGRGSIGEATYSLTLPGYSRTHDAALVEVSMVDSPMSGGGELVFLRKVGRSWRIVAKKRTTIS